MYAIVRADLEMPAGKMSAQAGHAFTESLFDCLDKDPGRALAYRRMRGSKVTLKARNLHALQRAHREAIEAGLPCSLFTDEGHVLLPHFDGSPVVTALGIGPCTQAEARHIAKRYDCVKEEAETGRLRKMLAARTSTMTEAVSQLRAIGGGSPTLQRDAIKRAIALVEHDLTDVQPETTRAAEVVR